MSTRASRFALRFVAAAVFLSCHLPTSALARAAEETASTEDLEQRVRILERKLENAEEEAASKAKTNAAASAGERGFSLRSADGNFDLKFRLLAQFDGRATLDPVPGSNDTFGIRRARPILEAQLGKVVFARLTPEFAGNSATVVDAYLDFKLSPLVTVRAGKVKGPVGLERLQSGGNTLFIERAYPTELAPNRDIGVSLQGDYDGGVVSYVFGLYNGAADGRDAAATDVDDKKEFAGRIFFEPFRNEPGVLQGLGFGVAGSRGTKRGTLVGQGGVLPQYRTPVQSVFFQYAPGVAAAGTHQRLTAHAHWFRHGLGLFGEYIESSQEIALGGASVNLEHDAWQLSASHVLTGEDTGFRGVAKPKAPFATGPGSGWGAWELVLRATELDVDDGAFAGFADADTAASRALTFGAGINWYVTSNAKLSLNYAQTEFEGGAPGGSDRADEKAVLARLQVTY